MVTRELQACAAAPRLPHQQPAALTDADIIPDTCSGATRPDAASRRVGNVVLTITVGNSPRYASYTWSGSEICT